LRKYAIKKKLLKRGEFSGILASVETEITATSSSTMARRASRKKNRTAKPRNDNNVKSSTDKRKPHQNLIQSVTATASQASVAPLAVGSIGIASPRVSSRKK